MWKMAWHLAVRISAQVATNNGDIMRAWFLSVVLLTFCNGCESQRFNSASLTQVQDHNTFNSGAIGEAVRRDDLERVTALLNGNRDLVFTKDSEGETPLHWASIKGCRDVAELLLADRKSVV